MRPVPEARDRVVPRPDVPPPPPGTWPLASVQPPPPPGAPAGAPRGAPYGAIGVGLGLSSAAIAVYFVTQLLLQLVVGFVGLGLDLLDPALLDPEASGGVGLLGLVVASQVAGLLAVLLLLRRRRVPLGDVVGPLRPAGRRVAAGVGLGIAALIGSSLLVSLLITLTGSEATPEQVLTEDLMGTPGELLLVVAAAVVMAPLVEELLFRGLLHRALRRRLTIAPATLLSSALFAVVHLDVATSQPLALAGLTLVGAVLAVAAERTGGLLVPVVIHATYNAVTILVVVLMARFAPDGGDDAALASLAPVLRGVWG